MADGNYFKIGKMTETELNQYNVSQLLGVDYSTNPLYVDDRHAVDMANYIMEDDTLQKRNGIKEIVDNGALYNFIVDDKIWQVFYTFDKKLGIYNNTLDSLAHKINGTYIGNYSISSSSPKTKYQKIRHVIKDNLIYLYVGGEDIIIINMETNKMVSVLNDRTTSRWELDDFINNTGMCPYIPLVVRNIQNKDNNVNQKAYDDFNLLSDFIRVSGKSHSNTSEYYLQNPNTTEQNVKYKLPFNPRINGGDYGIINSLFNPFIEYEHNLPEGVNLDLSKYVKLKVNDTWYDFITDVDNLPTVLSGQSISGYFYISEYGVYAYFENDDHDIDIYGEELLVFTSDFENKQPGKDNWELIYPYYIEGNKEKILKAQLLYEYTGLGTTVLFVTDGESNIDYHTVDDNYLYFSDLNYSAYGSSKNPIMGYQTLQDGSLCVMKGNKIQEPTMYFRNAELVQAVDYEGSAVDGEKELQYPITIGNNGEELINSDSFLNFGNETVFLSKNGLQAITVGSTSSSLIRYSEPRSEPINSQLKKIDLANAPCCVFNHRLYIVDKENSRIFVADERYTYNGQYEWFVYKFEEDLSSTQNFIQNNENLILVLGDRYLKLECEEKIDKYLLINVRYDIYIIHDNEEDYHYLNLYRYDDQAGDQELDDEHLYEVNENELCVIETLNDGYIIYSYTDENGEQVEGTLNKVIVVYDSETNRKKYYKYDTMDEITVTGTYGGTETRCYVNVYKYKGIKSFFITKPYNFGNSLYSKNVYRYVITRDTIRDNDLEIGVNYKANYSTAVTTLNNTKMAEWFDIFDFNTFALTDFDNPYVVVYKTHIRRINTLQFVFRSNTLKNSVINPFTIEYTFGFRNKGGM